MRLRIVTAVLVLSIAVLAVLAWNRSTTQAPAGEGGEGAAPAGEAGAPGTEPAPPAQDPGVAWQKPARWVEELASGMRLATYVVPAASGAGPARCAVHYFGPGEGGGTDANIERWIGEFESAGEPVRRDYRVGGFQVTQVTVSGTYRAHATPAQGEVEAAAGVTLLGAIVEGPNGAMFFKLTGPSATVAPAAKEFEAMLGSLRSK